VDRSDHDYPDIGHIPDTRQQMTWRLWSQHTAMLVEEARASCDYDLAEISRGEAEQIAAGAGRRSLAAGRGPAALGRLGLFAVRPTWTEPITRTWPSDFAN
jgi:hypothetical protein